jgi:hypothetical protein
MTKMLNVTIDTNGINQEEASAWAQELANVYADMEIDNIKVSGNKISFTAGFSGMDDTQPEDIKTRLDEYLTMNEAFQTKSVSVQ